MNDKAKLGLSIAAIVICGGFIVSFVSSSGTSADFPDGGTWAECSTCGEMQVIDPEIRGRFYDDNPDQEGQPMICPKCNNGRLVDGLKCPVNSCFYLQAGQLADGRPVCPTCKKPLP
ncbi:MAG: hypothetical protein HOH62_00420 [Verrucomicrobia bacterium]|nr:hypothetical protein [Verrucomicrobiota bacterium]